MRTHKDPIIKYPRRQKRKINNKTYKISPPSLKCSLIMGKIKSRNTKIEEKLRKYKGQKEGEEDFYVQTFEEIMAMFGSVINILNGILVLIALISLFVASVNITNTMYTAVLERTKEIGIMKSVGAKNSDILTLFLIESGLLGLVGGLIGVGVGAGIGKSVEYIALTQLGTPFLQASISLELVLGALLFSFVVGSFSGVLPAIQASRMRPVEALRHE